MTKPKAIVPHSLGAAIEYYTSAMKLKSSSLRSYELVRKKLGDFGLLEIPLFNLTPADIRKFLNSLRDQAPATVYSIYYMKTKAVIHRYIKEHNLDVKLNLDGIMKPPKHEDPPKGEERHMTLAELTQLAEIDLSNDEGLHYGRELFLLMCYSGMAVADVVNFTPEKAISTEGGQKWFTYYRKKNGKKCTVPLLPMLENLIARNKWPVKVGVRMITYRIAPLSALVGRPIGCHGGRHTFGCIMLELGFSMASVSAMMGHGSIQTTEKHYAKVSQDKISRELSEIPEKLKMMMQ